MDFIHTRMTGVAGSLWDPLKRKILATFRSKAKTLKLESSHQGKGGNLIKRGERSDQYAYHPDYVKARHCPE